MWAQATINQHRAVLVMACFMRHAPNARSSPPSPVADHIMAAQGSGEFALRHILEPLAHGREPLEDALQNIQVRTGRRAQEGQYELCFPVSTCGYPAKSATMLASKAQNPIRLSRCWCAAQAQHRRHSMPSHRREIDIKKSDAGGWQKLRVC